MWYQNGSQEWVMREFPKKADVSMFGKLCELGTFSAWEISESWVEGSVPSIKACLD